MSHTVKKVAASGAALAALALGGAALADAASSSSSQTTTTSTTSGRPAAPPSGRPNAPPNFPAPGTAAHENAEKAVTGADATKAQEAAVKSVGGGTAGDVTTNYTGNGYEVTVTKSDGTKVEVHLDSSFNVMPGPPSRGGMGGPHGTPPGPPPGQGA